MMVGLTAGDYREWSGVDNGARIGDVGAERGAAAEWMRLLGHCCFFIGRREDGRHGMGWVLS
jgi:hypothetical protein